MLVHRGLATGHPPMQNLYEFLMCAAALIPALTFFARRERHALLVDSLLLALVMIPVGFVMDGRVKHLMPALQSPFFVPHVGSYVLGYILLVRAALGTGRRLVGLGFFLLTVGLVLGAAWGKVCWGHWWQFDPVRNYSVQGDVVGHRPTNEMCIKTKAIIRYLMEKLHEGDPETIKIFWSWIK